MDSKKEQLHEKKKVGHESKSTKFIKKIKTQEKNATKRFEDHSLQMTPGSFQHQYLKGNKMIPVTVEDQYQVKHPKSHKKSVSDKKKITKEPIRTKDFDVYNKQENTDKDLKSIKTAAEKLSKNTEKDLKLEKDVSKRRSHPYKMTTKQKKPKEMKSIESSATKHTRCESDNKGKLEEKEKEKVDKDCKICKKCKKKTETRKQNAIKRCEERGHQKLSGPTQEHFQEYYRRQLPELYKLPKLKSVFEEKKITKKPIRIEELNVKRVCNEKCVKENPLKTAEINEKIEREILKRNGSEHIEPDIMSLNEEQPKKMKPSEILKIMNNIRLNYAAENPIYVAGQGCDNFIADMKKYKEKCRMANEINQDNVPFKSSINSGEVEYKSFPTELFSVKTGSKAPEMKYPCRCGKEFAFTTSGYSDDDNDSNSGFFNSKKFCAVAKKRIRVSHPMERFARMDMLKLQIDTQLAKNRAEKMSFPLDAHKPTTTDKK